MELEALLENVDELSDLELAVLLCLMMKEHCIIETEDQAIEDSARKLEQVRIIKPGITS